MDFLDLIRLVTYFVYALSIFPTLELYIMFVRDGKLIKNQVVKRVNKSILFLLRSLLAYQFLNIIRYAVTIANDGVANEIHSGLNLVEASLFFASAVYLKRVFTYIAKNRSADIGKSPNAENN